jgi:hypothetical protein
VAEERKVRESVESWLKFYRMRFVDLDELQGILENAIRKDTGMDCYYYVDEDPIKEHREFYEPDGVRLDVEEAVDSVRCKVGDREVDLVYVRMKRGVVELPNGKQFWLIVDLLGYGRGEEDGL